MAKAPTGWFLVLPCFDTFNKVDMRTLLFEMPEQVVCTKDRINISIDGVVYYRVSNADGTVFELHRQIPSAKIEYQ